MMLFFNAPKKSALFFILPKKPLSIKPLMTICAVGTALAGAIYFLWKAERTGCD